MTLYTVTIYRRWRMQEHTLLNVDAKNKREAENVAARIQQDNPDLFEWRYQEPVGTSPEGECEYEYDHEYVAAEAEDFEPLDTDAIVRSLPEK